MVVLTVADINSRRKMTLLRATTKIKLRLPNVLTGPNPALTDLLPTLIRKFVQRRPVDGMLIFELDISAAGLE